RRAGCRTSGPTHRAPTTARPRRGTAELLPWAACRRSPGSFQRDLQHLAQVQMFLGDRPGHEIERGGAVTERPPTLADVEHGERDREIARPHQARAVTERDDATPELRHCTELVALALHELHDLRLGLAADLLLDQLRAL